MQSIVEAEGNALQVLEKQQMSSCGEAVASMYKNTAFTVLKIAAF